MPVPAGALGIARGGSGHCSRASGRCSEAACTAPGALCVAPGTLSIVLRLRTSLLGLCAVPRGLYTQLQRLLHCSGGSVQAPGGSVHYPGGSARCSRACAHCPEAVYIAPGALCTAVILQPGSKNTPAAAAAAPSRPAARCPQQHGRITATSQPPSASPRQPLTACVSGHTSISQGQPAQHRWPFALGAAGRPPGALVTPACHQQPGPGSVPPPATPTPPAGAALPPALSCCT